MYYTGVGGITVLNYIIEKILALSKGKILGTDLLFLSSRSESRYAPPPLNPSDPGLRTPKTVAQIWFHISGRNSQSQKM